MKGFMVRIHRLLYHSMNVTKLFRFTLSLKLGEFICNGLESFFHIFSCIHEFIRNGQEGFFHIFSCIRKHRDNNESIKTLETIAGAARATKIIYGYPMNNNRVNLKDRTSLCHSRR